MSSSLVPSGEAAQALDAEPLQVRLEHIQNGGFRFGFAAFVTSRY